MPTITEIVTKFTADTAGMVANVKNAHSALQETKTHADAAGGGITGMISKALPMAAVIGVTAGVAGGLGLMVHAAADSEVVMARTNSVLASTHGVAGQTAQSVTDLAGHIMNLSGIDDEAVQTGENMLLTFTNIGKNVFPQATQAVADMATGMNQGMLPSSEQMQASSILLGKALNDPIGGVTALKKAGVQLTEQEQKNIATAMKHGDIAKAQGIILGELQTQFGGAAQAAGGTFNGKLALLMNTLSNVAETIGGMLLPALTGMVSAIVPIVARLTDFATYLQQNQGAMDAFKAVLIVAAAVIGTVLVASFVAWAIAAGAAAIATIAATWPVLAVIAAIALLVLGIKLLIDHWSEIATWLKSVWSAIVVGVQLGLQTLGKFFDNLGTTVHDFFANIIAAAIAWGVGLVVRFVEAKNRVDQAIGEMISNVVSFFAALPGRVFAFVADLVLGVVNWFVTMELRGLAIIAGFIAGMLGNIRGAIGAAAGAMSSVASAILGVLGDLGGRLASLVRNAISNMISAILGMAGNVASAFGKLFSGFHLPHFASGGDVPGGLTVVGENGPEVVALPAGSHVYPHGSGPSVGSGGSGGSSGSGSSAPQIIQLVVDDAGLRVLATALMPKITNELRARLGVKLG